MREKRENSLCYCL